MNIQLSNPDWQAGTQVGATSDASPDLSTGLSREQFEKWHDEIKAQPPWRAQADKEADYCDGNQLDSEVLRKQQAIGMAPAIEPLIGPVIDSVLGMEAQHRTDWRVVPDSDTGGDDVALALNHKLNLAEKKSKADRACSEAFAGQAKVGIGWVEVCRDSDPFKYPYRCNPINRNEISWDFRAVELDLSDARYLVRRKWTDKEQAMLIFPDQADLISNASSGWSNYESSMTGDGGHSTGLAMRGNTYPITGAVGNVLGLPVSYQSSMSNAYSNERGSSLEEQEWRDTHNSRVCLFEVWYRVWSRALVMSLPDGRVVEYDPDNMMHLVMVSSGAIKPEYKIISKVRLSWWLGPHKLSDEATPYRHNKFPYVPFWGKREDRTGVPYGLVRGMMYLQDNVNATTSKIRWGLSAVNTVRTAGAFAGTDAQFRQISSRVDADFVLDQKHMAQPGARFERNRDFQLNEQQYKMLNDSREGIKRVGGIQNAFMGQGTSSQSGIAITSLAEQSTQSLADLYDNFRTARTEVGELLLSMIVEDMIGNPETVIIKGHAVNEDKQIQLNVSKHDPETGMQYLDNDIERTLVQVDLEEVPSTPSFRAQQLNALSEAFKSAPPEYQKIMMPYLFQLMDVPNRQQIIEAIKNIDATPTQEQIQQQIQQAVQDALQKAQIDLKNRDLDIKERGVNSQAVKVGVEAAYAAMQAGQVIAQMPQVAPIADAVMQSAGYQASNPAGVDPNYPHPNVAVPPVQQSNPNPILPAPSATPGIGEMRGIETQRPDGVR